MKKFVIILICCFTPVCIAQNLYADPNGVRIFYEIEKTDMATFCNRANTSGKKYSSSLINIWKITLGIENGSLETIFPRGVGIANIHIVPDPIKPYASDYCQIEILKNYKPNNGTSGHSLFAWPIRNYAVSEVKSGEIIKNTTYIYLYEGQTPTLTKWEFIGYQSAEDFKKRISNKLEPSTTIIAKSEEEFPTPKLNKGPVSDEPKENFQL